MCEENSPNKIFRNLKNSPERQKISLNLVTLFAGPQLTTYLHWMIPRIPQHLTSRSRLIWRSKMRSRWLRWWAQTGTTDFWQREKWNSSIRTVIDASFALKTLVPMYVNTFAPWIWCNRRQSDTIHIKAKWYYMKAATPTFVTWSQSYYFWIYNYLQRQRCRRLELF
jgi:hypothetical protein